MRALLICLSTEGLTHAALSAGRRAALLLLATDEGEEALSSPDPESHALVVEALEVLERTARAKDRKEAREDQPRDKGPGGGGDRETEAERRAGCSIRRWIRWRSWRKARQIG